MNELSTQFLIGQRDLFLLDTRLPPLDVPVPADGVSEVAKVTFKRKSENQENVHTSVSSKKVQKFDVSFSLDSTKSELVNTESDVDRGNSDNSLPDPAQIVFKVPLPKLKIIIPKALRTTKKQHPFFKDGIKKMAIDKINKARGVFYPSLYKAIVGFEERLSQTCWYVSSQNPYDLRKVHELPTRSLIIHEVNTDQLKQQLKDCYLREIILSKRDFNLRSSLISFIKDEGIQFFETRSKAIKELTEIAETPCWFIDSIDPFIFKKLNYYPVLYTLETEKITSIKQLNRKLKKLL